MRQAIETSFDGVFVPLFGDSHPALEEEEEESSRQWQKARVQEMLENLGPPTWSSQKKTDLIPTRICIKEVYRSQYRWNNGNRLIDACVFFRSTTGGTVGWSLESGMMGEVYGESREAISPRTTRL